MSTLETMFFIVEPVSAMQDGDAINKSKFTLKSEAFFNYLDYLEFQEARKFSKQAIESSLEATKLAKESIKLTKYALIFSILFSVLAIFVQIHTSQSTEIDERQFDEIKNLISSEIRK
jgi:hypothetical protein